MRGERILSCVVLTTPSSGFAISCLAPPEDPAWPLGSPWEEDMTDLLPSLAWGLLCHRSVKKIARLHPGLASVGRAPSPPKPGSSCHDANGRHIPVDRLVLDPSLDRSAVSAELSSLFIDRGAGAVVVIEAVTDASGTAIDIRTSAALASSSLASSILSGSTGDAHAKTSIPSP